MMDAVLDWLATDLTIAQHPAFGEFRRHIRSHLFDRVGALDAWRWFKQGWEARNVDAASYETALRNIAEIDDQTDASAAAAYATAVLEGADPDENEDGSRRAHWIRTVESC